MKGSDVLKLVNLIFPSSHIANETNCDDVENENLVFNERKVVTTKRNFNLTFIDIRDD